MKETKGCTQISISESNSILCAAGKRKIDIYAWNGVLTSRSATSSSRDVGLVHRREILLQESPRAIFCLNSGFGVVMAMKKTYEYLDFSVANNITTVTNVVTTLKLIEIERDQKNVGLEVYFTVSI